MYSASASVARTSSRSSVSCRTITHHDNDMQRQSFLTREFRAQLIWICQFNYRLRWAIARTMHTALRLLAAPICHTSEQSSWTHSSLHHCGHLIVIRGHRFWTFSSSVANLNNLGIIFERIAFVWRRTFQVLFLCRDIISHVLRSVDSDTLCAFCNSCKATKVMKLLLFTFHIKLWIANTNQY